MSFFRPLSIGVAACVAASVISSGSASVEDPLLAADDECQAAGSDTVREQCAVSALQRRGLKVHAEAEAARSNVTEGEVCATLDDLRNSNCKSVVNWVAFGGGKNDPQANKWFKDMVTITGVDYHQAGREDFQRLYYCAPPGGKACATPPCTCSKPPCDVCLAGQKPASSRKICTDNPDSAIACKPPINPMAYKGMEWPTIIIEGTKEQHIFAIGDWGGMDGSLNPIEGRPHIIAYTWGARAGPSVFPRTRWDMHHKVELCSHKQFIECFNSHGDSSECPDSCGYVAGVDDQPQQLVASAMAERAALMDPGLILNVGDNFYWGGIEKTCGTPMGEISFTAHHQFDQIYEQVYKGPGLDGKPWFSVLGNHDWGGRQFNNGWDQQIAYTWVSDRWVMPAPYYMARVEYVDQGFSVDLFMADTNFNDAKESSEDSEHNICGSAHNPPGATCGVIGGPMSIETCVAYFQQLWSEQKVWLQKKLSESKATWQILVTHFPCGEDGENQAFYRKLHQQYGLDLLVTGHRHDQELWTPSMTYKNFMGGLTCFVTGGGGGITSEATPNPEDKKDWYGEGEYGFYDLTITKASIKIESINYDGKVLLDTIVYPK